MALTYLDLPDPEEIMRRLKRVADIPFTQGFYNSLVNKLGSRVAKEGFLMLLHTESYDAAKGNPTIRLALMKYWHRWIYVLLNDKYPNEALELRQQVYVTLRLSEEDQNNLEAQLPTLLKEKSPKAIEPRVLKLTMSDDGELNPYALQAVMMLWADYGNKALDLLVKSGLTSSKIADLFTEIGDIQMIYYKISRAVLPPVSAPIVLTPAEQRIMVLSISAEHVPNFGAAEVISALYQTFGDEALDLLEASGLEPHEIYEEYTDVHLLISRMFISLQQRFSAK